MTRRGFARLALLVAWGSASCDGGTRSLGVGPTEKAVASSGGTGSSKSPTGGTAGTNSSPSGGANANSAGRAGSGNPSSGGAGTTAGAGGTKNGGSGTAGELADAGAAGNGSTEPAPTGRGTLTRLSVTNDGVPGDGDSLAGRASRDGRFVAFYSLARNLAPPDDNGVWDVFLHDRGSARSVLASADPSGKPGDNGGVFAAASNAGSVCFGSASSNLAPDRTTDWTGIYVAGPGTASDAFLSRILPVTPADADEASEACTLSDDGRFVAFQSQASNLIPGTTSALATYLFDATTGTTQRIRFGLDGIAELDNRPLEGPLISPDGSFMTVQVVERGVETIVVHRFASGETERVVTAHDGSSPDAASYFASPSADGRRVAFCSDATNLVADDTNGVSDAFIRDLDDGSVERVSVSDTGVQADGGSYELALSGDGRWLAFWSSATNLLDGSVQEPGIYLRDLEKRVTVRVALPVPEGEQGYSGLSLSHNGETLVFSSNVPNLVEDDDAVMDVYAFDFER